MKYFETRRERGSFSVALLQDQGFTSLVITGWRLLALCICIAWGTLLLSPAHASPPAGGTDAEASREKPVMLGGDVLFVLTEPHGARSAAARATAASQVLEQAVRDKETNVVTRIEGETATIRVGGRLVVQLEAADVKATSYSDLDVYAKETSGRIKRALVHEKSRRQIAERVLAVSSLVFWAFVSWILIIVAGRMARRMVKRINAMEGKVGALELHQVELLPAAAGREALRMLVYVALWVVRVGLVYVWVLGALSLSPATQAHAKSATAYLFAPALDLVVQLASRLPLLIALLLAFLVVSFVVRFVMVYSRAIERGEIESEWVRPETARTSGTLLVVALCLSTLLFLTPILAGSADGSLPRMGLLGLGAVALGATPLLGSCLIGIRAVYSRAWGKGDLVEYGGKRGRVEQLGLFEITLRREDGAIVRVPHLMSLWHATTIHGQLAEVGEGARPREGSAAEEKGSAQPDGDGP